MLASDFHRILSDAVSLLPSLPALRPATADGYSVLGRLFKEGTRGRPLPAGFLYMLAETYGENPAALGTALQRISSLCVTFVKQYGDARVRLLRAPARINILGEHVDYVSYLPTCSLPFGSREHDMLMLYASSESGRVRGASRHDDYVTFDFSFEGGPPTGGVESYEADWLSYIFGSETPLPHWANYVKGSVFFARVKFGERVTRGFDFVIDSSIQPKGGASSSSALTVLAGAAIRGVNEIAFEPGALAEDSSKAEWFVGTRGGSMDHLTICLARRAQTVLISYLELNTRLLRLPPGRLRWVTFFTHPADKGREIMLEYNERAAVSRLIIPALIEGWARIAPERHADWGQAFRALRAGVKGAARELESLLRELPETVTLEELSKDYEQTYDECVKVFPALVEGRRGRPLLVRAYALHHLGEIRRVSAAEQLLDSSAAQDEIAHPLGQLLNESHESLRDLYGVSTPEVERLIRIALSDPGVRGARLMGGGFGGNVLVLTNEESLPALKTRVQAEFYAPLGRDGAREGSVMVSTPGDGLSELSLVTVWRQAVEEFNAQGTAAVALRTGVCAMLDEIETDEGSLEVWPVIVAAGKGARALESGLNVPKPVAPVACVPAILRVLRNVREGCGEGARAPIVIVSPETEGAVRAALAGEKVSYVVQTEPLGTGDAVLCARELMKEFSGRALVIWGTQPVITSRTIRRALKLASLFKEHDMILPTALKERPYAPVERDARGRILASRETHLEGAPRPEFGETNSGLFILKSTAMFDALQELRRRHWQETAGRYDRPRGELGFPNEMVKHFAGRESGVLACPFADGREEQGIKTLEDVALCEQFIAELEEEAP